MHLCAESWGGVREQGEINHFQVRKGSCSPVCFLIHPFLCAFVIQKSASGTLQALKLAVSDLVPGLQVLRVEPTFSDPTDWHVQESGLEPRAEHR